MRKRKLLDWHWDLIANILFSIALLIVVSLLASNYIEKEILAILLLASILLTDLESQPVIESIASEIEKEIKE